MYRDSDITYTKARAHSVKAVKEHTYFEKQRYIFARRLMSIQAQGQDIIYFDESICSIDKCFPLKVWQPKDEALLLSEPK